MHNSSHKYIHNQPIETYGEWHQRTYEVAVPPGSIDTYEIWQEKFTLYIASKNANGSQFKIIDSEIAQMLFDKATGGVLAQKKPSFIGKHSFDSTVSYFSIHEGQVFKCPVGHLLSDEQVIKYNICPARLICGWEDELIMELVPNSSVVCARHFISKLQRAHTRAYLAFKKSKGKSDFIADYINESNIVAKEFGLKEVQQ